MNCCDCERVSGASWGLTVTRFELETVTATLAELLPPAPVQAKEKLVVVASARVEVRPLAGLAPPQPSEASHAVALVELQTSVVVVPGPIDIGIAVRLTVGDGVVAIFESAALALIVVADSSTEAVDTAAAFAPRAPVVNAIEAPTKRTAATNLPMHTRATANFLMPGNSAISNAFSGIVGMWGSAHGDEA